MEIHVTIRYLMVTKIVKGRSCSTFNYTIGLVSEIHDGFLLGSKLVGSLSN